MTLTDILTMLDVSAKVNNPDETKGITDRFGAHPYTLKLMGASGGKGRHALGEVPGRLYVHNGSGLVVMSIEPIRSEESRSNGNHCPGCSWADGVSANFCTAPIFHISVGMKASFPGDVRPHQVLRLARAD